MLKTKMYVRCPADKESINEPRVFVCGQVMSIDEFKKTVSVKIHDPFGFLVFFEDLPKGVIELPIISIDRCKLFISSIVMVNGEQHKVLSCQSNAEDGFYYYYVQNCKTRELHKVSERDITAAFNNGQVDPCTQMKNYEFQNPAWYLGRAVVSKSMNILENSIFGFKELAGSKIYLLPHQVNTIMRCLQETPCRYMLADEVGMGKTVEAISIYKLFTMNQSNTKAMILVPKALKEQWIAELLLKFNLPNGIGANNNVLVVKCIEEISDRDISTKWDFVIIDEVHKYLFEKEKYEIIHSISRMTKNLLLLSATPVQQKKEEYLDLLRLLLPSKYDSFSVEKFGELIEKQGKIIQKTALILDDLGDFEEEISSAETDIDPHSSEDCKELYEEIYDDLTEICDDLEDEKLSDLLDEIHFEDDDLGVYRIKVIVSYICGNYQIESNIIRNRRKILEDPEDDVCLMATRDLVDLEYTLDNDKALYEQLTYNELADWIVKGLETKELNIENDVKPVLSSFFSSPWAFSEKVRTINASDTLLDNARKWLNNEKYIVDNIDDILNDPDAYEDCYSSRLVVVLNALFDEFYDKKVVLFTNYAETFAIYKSALGKVFDENEVCFFGESISSDENELNVYRYQTQKECRIMLCDYTGGEGRNFQCADYIIHIDLPWDASAIEQRIGRLDRLERDMSRPIVYSVVVHTKDTFEEALFSFFRDGLNIFNQSLSGMEIIMKDINNEIISAISADFKYGLFEKIPHIIDLANSMRDIIRKEQNFDAAGFIYRPMYAELRRLIEYYSFNENDLFASTMSNWASLAGFHGTAKKNGEILYSAQSFSPKSAINSQLIPPKWNDYLNSEQNKVLTRVQEAFDKKVTRQSQERAIRGTFSRKLAIENDYLHFFAPGDEVFDCIVDNAINSCKGCASAFAALANINWSGLVFTWSMVPDNAFMLDKGVSLYAMSPYRNYLLSDQVVIPVSINNPDELEDEEIIREYLAIVNRGFTHKSSLVHLGKRSREAGFLKTEFEGRNIDWFIRKYGGENWGELVASSRKLSHAKALEVFKRRSNLKGAKEEMERTLSARVANREYYGISDDGIEELRETQNIVLEAMKHPKLHLESVAFIMMIGAENG